MTGKAQLVKAGVSQPNDNYKNRNKIPWTRLKVPMTCMFFKDKKSKKLSLYLRNLIKYT